MAVDVRAELTKVYNKHGRLTPEILRDEARAKGHPLHPRIFDRPVGEAAEAWYLHRSHELIREVMAEYKRDDGPPLRVRAFPSIQTEQGFEYQPVEEVAADPFRSRLKLQEMERDWRRMESLYGDLDEFVALCQKTSRRGQRKAA